MGSRRVDAYDEYGDWDEDDVRAVMRFATAHHVPVVPRGAGSSVVGGSTAVEGAVTLSLEAMDGIAVDAAAMTVTAGPGAVTGAVRLVASHDAVPAYDRRLPGGGPARPSLEDHAAEVVLFAACVGTMFGPEDGPREALGAAGALVRLAERAGVRLRTPAGLGGLCCGTPWKSRGLSEGYAAMARRVLPALWEASEHGRLPVVGDAVSCTEGLAVMVAHAAEHGHPECRDLRLVDGVELAATTLLPRLPEPRRVGTVVVHPTCGTTALGVTGHLTALAGHLAERVVVPDEWGCCGFAGDRGLLHPELTASATAPEVAELERLGALGADVFVSANRTCEIGMTRATGRPYRHVLELLEEATRPALPPPAPR